MTLIDLRYMVLSFRMVPSIASSMVLSMLGRQDLLLFGSSIPSTRNGIHYVNWGYVERMGCRAQWYLSCLREGGGTLEEEQQKGSSSLPLPLTALKPEATENPLHWPLAQPEFPRFLTEMFELLWKTAERDGRGPGRSAH